MDDVLLRYKKVDYVLPEGNLSWLVHHPGLEFLGQEGKPVRLPRRELHDDEILLRVDAVGLCFSDVKMITQGSAHPRVNGRDLEKDPTVPGHEASLTVVQVGKGRAKDFRVGQRFTMHVEVFYQGKLMSFGYYIPGAVQQFIIAGKEIIDGDEGCYLLPVQETTGYAEVGLSEPWACVLASYSIPRREHLKPGGNACFIGVEQAEQDEYVIEKEFLEQGTPAKIVAINIHAKQRDRLLALAGELHFSLIFDDDPGRPEMLSAKHTGGMGFDDIVVFGPPAPELAESAGAILAKGGIFAVLSARPLARNVLVDVERVHYGGHFFTGSTSPSLAEAYKPKRSLAFKPGGKALFIGAGGPMGQMHVQWACESRQGPNLIVVTDLDTQRLKKIETRLSPAAKARGARLVTFNPKDLTPEQLEQTLRKECGSELFDEVVILAPVASAIEFGAAWLGREGVLNIFAGIPKSTKVPLNLSGCYMQGHQWVGSSGAPLAVVRRTLDLMEKGEISPNQSVAAIAGLGAALAGLKAVKAGMFPGKIVIWPQLVDLPLIPLDELGKYLPNVAAKLTAEGVWTKEAEEELLRTQFRLGQDTQVNDQVS